MGTNFYFQETDGVHIGKRSAAGPYCWDCGVSLCNTAYDDHTGKYLYGNDAVHYCEGDDGWLTSCPICGREETNETIQNSTAGRELGFNKETPKKKSGVSSCCSFSWAISPKRFQDIAKSWARIFDEYDREYTLDEFRSVLEECPIKYYDSVWVDFS